MGGLAPSTNGTTVIDRLRQLMGLVLNDKVEWIHLIRGLHQSESWATNSQRNFATTLVFFVSNRLLVCLDVRLEKYYRP